MCTREELQAQAYAIFEESETELQAREQMIEEALANHVDLTRLYEEISLVMPPSTGGRARPASPTPCGRWPTREPRPSASTTTPRP